MRLILVYTSFILFSCLNSDKQADFYSYKKRWDLWRVPILEPYEIVSPTKSLDVHNWHLIIKKPSIYNKDYFDQVNEYEFQLSGIDSISVADSVLIFKSSNRYWPKLGGNHKTTFIIDAKTSQQFIFSDDHHKTELKNTLISLGVENAKFYDAQMVKDEFQSKLILPKDWNNQEKDQ